MFQTLIVIASIVVLSGAILTSALVTAKNSFHQIVVAKTSTAMNDATSQFVFWAQKFVAKYGTEANWEAASAQHAPLYEKMCETGASECPFGATMLWRVTGATIGVPPAPMVPGQPPSTAVNMTPAVDEQRISATISVIVTNANGRTTFGGRTQEVTARVFDVPPYVVITATRDLSSNAGTVSSAEGDSGGTKARGLLNVQATPAATIPYEYTDTLIKATIECANTTLFDETNPRAQSDDGHRLFDPSYRPGGSLSWAYEMPCDPTQGVPSAPIGTVNYMPPFGSTYQIYASDVNTIWHKGDNNSSSFAR